MIRAVTFDVGGTLAAGELDKKAFAGRAVEYLSGLGYRVDARSYRRALGLAMRELQRLRSSGRDMGFRRFYSLVLSGLGIRPRDEILEGLRELYFRSFVSELLPGAEEVLRALHGRYLLAAISNSISSWPRRFLEEHGLAGYLRAIVISGEVGWRKPHRRIFEVALSELGVEPSEAVHVGDSIEEDVRGAKAVGMKAILLAPDVLKTGPGVEADAVVGSLYDIPAVLAEMG